MASRNEGERVLALSLQLTRTHDELRRRIRDIKAGLGRAGGIDEALRTHCLAFCSALTTHHRGEDEGLFAELLRERPDLAGTIANLVQDHTMISGILARVVELAGQAAEGRAADGQHADPAAIGRELDGLAAIMESHFRYEERALAAALDAGVPDTGWSGPVLSP
ncbi:hemerythrin domain-containing protein [Streptomyces sp. NRRL WC-3742]|uniref:hemerythrin domain-containing protein n=1 Tax=Streptomyces sp. NRRL WC-3742 TaxID=1463934 RepID=UPI00055C4CB6|nr:hemerythrin domain-containing protein [Streptomyces sp. NRRL WC-3742]